MSKAPRPQPKPPPKKTPTTTPAPTTAPKTGSKPAGEKKPAPAAGSGSSASGSKPAGERKPAPAASDRKPATGDKKPATGERKPATGERKPATGERKPATGERKPATGDRKPATGDRKQTGDKKAAGGKPGDKKQTGDKKAAGGDKKAAGKAGDKKPAGDKKAAPAKVAGGKVTKGKKVAPLPAALKGKTTGGAEAAPKPSRRKHVNPLIEKNAKNFGIGGTVQPKRDLGRFVKWPKYIRIQRQRAILKKRLKVPPSIHQFSKTLDKNTAIQLFRLLAKYRPETHKQKMTRLKAAAEAKVEGEKKGQVARDPAKRPYAVKYGLNHITALIENKKAQLVVIADDVDPIELVVWLPALCRKMDVPYCIVKGKARLGTVVHKKNAAALCLSAIRQEDQKDLATLVTAVRANYNEKVDEIRKSWGGGIMGSKSRARIAKIEKFKLKEALTKRS